MSEQNTIFSRAAVVTQGAGKRAVPVGVLVALITAATGWFASHTKHDSSETVRRGMWETVVVLSIAVETLEANALDDEHRIRILEVSLAIAETRLESMGADELTFDDVRAHRAPPPRRRPRSAAALPSYEQLILDQEDE